MSLKLVIEVSIVMRYLRKSSRFFKFLKFQIHRLLLVKVFGFSNIVIINVDQNRMLSLTVKVLVSYSHFQNLRENAYLYIYMDYYAETSFKSLHTICYIASPMIVS